MLVEFAISVVLILIGLKIYSKLSIGLCTSPVCLIGKTALITGGNSGIGFETALQLAGRGCRVIIAARNCDKIKEKIIKETNNENIVVKQFDLASLSSVRSLAEDIIKNEERLDILINNAGTAGLDSSYTEDGLHLVMQVNHFGSFLLTHLLIDLLKKSSPSRIIFVSSYAAYFANLKAEQLNSSATNTMLFYAKFMEYCNSKLCNVIAARGFAQKLKGTGVTSNSLHPGIIGTPIFLNYFKNCSKHNKDFIILIAIRHIMQWFHRSPSEGAQTMVHLSLAKEVENISGEYFIECRKFYTPWQAKNIDFANQVWKLSENYVKLSGREKL